MSNNYIELFEFAKNLAVKANKILLERRKNVKIVTRKGELHNFTTAADLEIEKFLIESIKKRYPKHAILTEESGIITGDSPYRWILDPIDGTWEYKVGMPRCGVIIALEFKDKTILGIVTTPQMNEFFSTVNGNGVYLNQERIICSKIDQISASFVFINHPSYKTPPEKLDLFFNISKKLTKSVYRLFPTHSSSMDICRVAQGTYDGFIWNNGTSKWWDICAGLFMVEEAGGNVTTLKGSKLTEYNYKQEGFVASNGKIHEQLLKIVNSVY